MIEYDADAQNFNNKLIEEINKDRTKDETLAYVLSMWNRSRDVLEFSESLFFFQSDKADLRGWSLSRKKSIGIRRNEKNEKR